MPEIMHRGKPTDFLNLWKKLEKSSYDIYSDGAT